MLFIAYLIEADVQKQLNTIIGSYPFMKDGRYGANFVMRSEDSGAADACAKDLGRKLAEAGYDSVAGGI